MALNIYEITQYVNLDVDDSYTEEEVARWFNRGIATYNMIPPITTYGFITINEGVIEEFADPYSDLSENFMLAIMVPFISSSIRGQESALMEKQDYYQEFIANATMYKRASNISNEFLLNKTENIDDYQIGENVFISDMDYAPFSGQWHRITKKVKKFEPLDEEWGEWLEDNKPMT